MSSSKFSDDFKRDAVAQITERGYPVREVAERLVASPRSWSTTPWIRAASSRVSTGPLF
ncbi:transposase [Pseudooceanicola sp. 502str34]